MGVTCASSSLSSTLVLRLVSVDLSIAVSVKLGTSALSTLGFTRTNLVPFAAALGLAINSDAGFDFVAFTLQQRAAQADQSRPIAHESITREQRTVGMCRYTQCHNGT